MKITAHVTIVAERTDGVTVSIEPGQSADVVDDVAKKLIRDGYASKAAPKQTDSEALPVKRRPGAKGVTVTTAGDKKPTKKETAAERKKRLLGDRGPDPDKGGDEPDDSGEDDNSED